MIFRSLVTARTQDSNFFIIQSAEKHHRMSRNLLPPPPRSYMHITYTCAVYTVRCSIIILYEKDSTKNTIRSAGNLHDIVVIISAVTTTQRPPEEGGTRGLVGLTGSVYQAQAAAVKSSEIVGGCRPSCEYTAPPARTISLFLALITNSARLTAGPFNTSPFAAWLTPLQTAPGEGRLECQGQESTRRTYGYTYVPFQSWPIGIFSSVWPSARVERVILRRYRYVDGKITRQLNEIAISWPLLYEHTCKFKWPIHDVKESKDIDSCFKS